MSEPDRIGAHVIRHKTDCSQNRSRVRVPINREPETENEREWIRWCWHMVDRGKAKWVGKPPPRPKSPQLRLGEEVTPEADPSL